MQTDFLLNLPGDSLDRVELVMALEQAFDRFKHRIACVIVEPVVGNMGCVPPAEGYLEALREITQRDGTLLIFDEVMTGFRVAWGGAQRRYIDNIIVAGFCATSRGCSYFPFSGSTLKTLARELRRYEQTKSSLHFSPDEPLSAILVRKLINARIKEAKA